MQNQNNQDKSTRDQADGKFDRNIASTGGDTYSKNLMKNPEESVRETEDASLQDKEYAFDEDNTDNEEFHDIDDLDSDTELTETLDNEDDLQ